MSQPTIDPFRQKAVEILRHLFSGLEGSVIQGLELSGQGHKLEELLSEPPQSNLGDLAFPCFILAKALKSQPAMIAKDFCQRFAALQKQYPGVSVSAAGPYLNFTFASRFYGEKLLETWIQEGGPRGGYFQDTSRLMIEYSQPNTHKELHVGHLRNACLGAGLVNLKKFAGYQVLASTFPGDVGTHVAKCLWYLRKNNLIDKAPRTNKGEWLGQMYSTAHLFIESETEAGRGEDIKKELGSILKELENKKGFYFDLWQETRQWSIELMRELYDWLGIQFDFWYWESEVDSPSVEFVKDLLKRGLLQESQGAVGMDLSDKNLGFCMLLKSDGTGLYATKDLELARRKFESTKIDRSMYVVDLRQSLHFQQVFEVLRRIGFSQAENCVHYAYNFVELPDGAMSSRKGNIIPVRQVIEKMVDKIQSTHLSKYQGEWSSEELREVAVRVARGALKYGMLKIEANKKIVFVEDEWLRTDGDSGPFLLYSCTRAKSLRRKFPLFSDNKLRSLQTGKSPQASAEWFRVMEVDWTLLEHSTERTLLQHLGRFDWTCAQSARADRVSTLCTYLFQLAQAFNHFYHEVPISQAATESLKNTRLALCFAFELVMEQGLMILGIPAPERM